MTSQLTTFNKLVRSKKDLLLCILCTLIIQVTITIITVLLDGKVHLLERHVLEKNNIWILFIFIISQFILLYAMFYKNLSFGIKQFLFVLFSILFGLTLSVTIYIIDDREVIEKSIISTLINLVVMVIFGFITVYFNYDLSWMGLLLLISLICLITIGYISIYTNNSKIKKTYSIATVILFSLYILYDTNMILLKYSNDTDYCIRGALHYYLDIINIFTSYLNLQKK